MANRSRPTTVITGTMNKDSILNALKGIKDPDTGLDITASGIIADLVVDGNLVRLTLSLRELNVGYKAELNQSIQKRIFESFPQAMTDVHFGQVDKESKQNRVLPQVKHIIAVASGKGGVGKSTISTALARTLVDQGYRTGLMDADLYGPSVPILLGMEGAKPKVEKIMGVNKIIPIRHEGLQVMSIGFIIDKEQAVVLRGPRLAGIIKQFVHDTSWPELDYLIIDLPPGTGDIQLTLVQTVPLTGVVMVTTPQELAVADAIKAMNMFMLPNVNVPILGVVENMSGFVPADAPDKKYDIFGQGGGESLATYGKTALLSQVPLLKAMNDDELEWVTSRRNYHFTEMTTHILERLQWRLDHMAETEVVQVDR